MWRKVIQRQETKTKLKEKQEAISNSINVSKQIKDKLDIDSKELKKSNRISEYKAKGGLYLKPKG